MANRAIGNDGSVRLPTANDNLGLPNTGAGDLHSLVVRSWSADFPRRDINVTGHGDIYQAHKNGPISMSGSLVGVPWYDDVRTNPRPVQTDPTFGDLGNYSFNMDLYVAGDEDDAYGYRIYNAYASNWVISSDKNDAATITMDFVAGELDATYGWSFYEAWSQPIVEPTQP